MCRTSRNSGIWRFSWLAWLGLACCSAAYSQTYGWTFTAIDGTVFNCAVASECGTQAAQDYVSNYEKCLSTYSTCYKYVSVTCSPSGAPTANNQSSSCQDTETVIEGPAFPAGGNCTSCGNTSHYNFSLTSVYTSSTHPPPNNCASLAGTTAFVGANVIGMACSAGCVVNTSLPTMVISPSNCPAGTCSSGAPVAYEGTYTGDSCTTASGQVNTASNCVTASGVQACGVQGSNCGTFNGDEVCPTSLPAGTCQSYASGGVACTASPNNNGGVKTPPGPNTGTAGTAATPTGTATFGTPGQPTSTTSYYYSSSVVAASTAVTQASSGGANVGNGGNTSGTATAITGSVSISGSSGTLTVQGTGPGGSLATTNANASGDGDCSANSTTCTADGSGSGLPGSSWSGDCTSASACLEGFYTAIQSAPILSGAAAIETAWPSGSCDIGSVTLATFANQSFNYGTTACEVFTNYIATPLSAIMLAVFAVAGILIVLSA